MFEKEAEEWVKENMDCCKTDNSVNQSIPYFDEEERCCAKSAFQDGAEFGYNKANEWHKDLPTEDVRLAIIEVEDCGYLLCEYRKGVWYDKGSSAVCKDWITQNIKRWKEIVLPEPLKESE